MKGNILNSPLLFSASLESHMSAYATEIKLQSFNEAFQKAQMDIVRQCERDNLSQLETMLRIEAMNQELKKSMEVSYGDTAPPAIQTPPLSIEEKYNPPMSLTFPSTGKISSTEKALKVISERVRRKKEFKRKNKENNKEYKTQEKTKKRLLDNSEARYSLKTISTKAKEHTKKQESASNILKNIAVETTKYINKKNNENLLNPVITKQLQQIAKNKNDYTNQEVKLVLDNLISSIKEEKKNSKKNSPKERSLDEILREVDNILPQNKKSTSPRKPPPIPPTSPTFSEAPTVDTNQSGVVSPKEQISGKKNYMSVKAELTRYYKKFNIPTSEQLNLTIPGNRRVYILNKHLSALQQIQR
jgi:hypothetical protein